MLGTSSASTPATIPQKIQLPTITHYWYWVLSLVSDSLRSYIPCCIKEEIKWKRNLLKLRATTFLPNILTSSLKKIGPHLGPIWIWNYTWPPDLYCSFLCQCDQQLKHRMPGHWYDWDCAGWNTEGRYRITIQNSQMPPKEANEICIKNPPKNKTFAFD